MKKVIFLSSVLSVGVVLSAEPLVSDVIARQGWGTRKVTVSYRLEIEPAVVTVDVQTNRGDGVWASIGAENQVRLSGDVNALVRPGTRSFVWDAGKDWPDRQISGGNIRFAVSAWVTNAPPDYMTVDLYGADDGTRVRYYAAAEFVPGGVTDERYKTTHLLLRKIPAAGVRWLMGSPADESGRMTDERGVNWETQHEVVLSDDYYMAVYETTQKQFSRYNSWHRSHPNNVRSVDGCPTGPEYDTYPLNRMFLTDFRGGEKGLGWPANHDVDETSWLGKLRAATGLAFDLPTEAQWEFACRAGTTTAWCNGEDAKGKPNEHVFGFGTLSFYANYNGLPLVPVGTKLPNGFGLYDMMGNVAEQCLDWAGDHPTDGGTKVDPVGAAKPEPLDLGALTLIVKGGRRGGVADLLRSGCRIKSKVQNWDEQIGFRVVCPALAR